MPGILYVVATPIGNLEDVTLRALRVLREVDLIAAEDTRRTARLLQHYSISTPTTSLHEHNERRKLGVLLARLEAGQRVALVTDAGTPTISDPGRHLVEAALSRHFPVQAIPGPSAVLAALVCSGFAADAFTFMGFVPSRSKDRVAWLSRLRQEPGTVVFFEAPHRIETTLATAARVLGERPIAVCRELTKLHEELVKGPIHDVLRRLGQPRGEYTVVLGPAALDPGRQGSEVSDAQLWSEFSSLTEARRVTRRQAVTRLAKLHRLSAREVYAALERAKKIGQVT